MTSRRATFLQKCTADFKDKEVERLRKRIIDIEAQAHVDVDPDKRHRGEIEAILLAKQMNGILMTNDLAAAKLAKEEGCEVAHFGTVLRVEMNREGLTADEAFSLCETIQLNAFPGFHYTGPMDLVNIRIPPGFESRSELGE